MDKKRKSSIIDLLPVIFSCILAAAVCIIGVLLYEYSVVLALILCVLGFALNYVCGILIHELGHIVAAKRCKMRIIYLNLGIVSVDYITKTLKGFTFFKKDAGEARFVPTEKITEKQLRGVALNGLIYSLVFFIIGVLAGILLSIATKSAIPYCLFTAGQAANFYIFAVNALSSDKSADGNVAFPQSSYVKVLAEISNIELEIAEGKIPTEPELIKHDNQPIALYYHYLFTAIGEGKEAALKVLDAITDLNALTDQEYALIFPELVFKACTENNLIEEYKTLAEDFFANDQLGVRVLRAHITFRKYLGDEKWADILQGSYRKLIEKELPFTVNSENALNG